MKVHKGPVCLSGPIVTIRKWHEIDLIKILQLKVLLKSQFSSKTIRMSQSLDNIKAKAIPLQAWTGP
jgi:hypothetical protein